MTHALLVLHTLQWHHPGGRALLQLAQAPTQDYHSYTHALLGGVEDKAVGPNDPPVKKTRENSAAKQLSPNRDVTTRFPARALRGAWMSMESNCPRHSSLRCSYLIVGSAPLFSRARKKGTLLHQSPYLPTCKAKANGGVFAAE